VDGHGRPPGPDGEEQEGSPRDTDQRERRTTRVSPRCARQTDGPGGDGPQPLPDSAEPTHPRLHTLCQSRARLVPHSGARLGTLTRDGARLEAQTPSQPRGETARRSDRESTPRLAEVSLGWPPTW